VEIRSKNDIAYFVEDRSGFRVRLQSHRLHIQGEDTKGLSSARAETGQCSVRQQERLFKVC